MAWEARRVGPVILLVIMLAGGLLKPAAGQTSGPQPLTLDGDWNFLADPGAALKINDLHSASNVRPIRVPSSWQSQFADLRDYAGVAWYWRTWTQKYLASE